MPCTRLCGDASFERRQRKLGASLEFDETERLLGLCGLSDSPPEKAARSGTKLQMENGLRAERTPRELRLFRAEEPGAPGANPDRPVEYLLRIPGSVDAPAFGMRLEASLGDEAETSMLEARLRACRPGDRVVLRHSRSRLKISEALRRARLPSAVNCPVLEWQGEIIWMPGVAIDSGVTRNLALTIRSTPIDRPSGV